ncbi:MAG: hypothetical protein JWP13_55 [Candidatus Saccharibacteria bacterium]|nr:hypothetical protein [Candidatus Saccharibacteria bacterium]
MDDQRQQIVEKLKAANNILVTVSANPTVDQLSACIGLTLLLNKMGKHATAVFSGQVPSTIEFLKPEDTIEKNTDSLRDFIIAIDKAKADKLRYKVEDEIVKIFITPYKASINEKDLIFSQGDFNVDVVMALGVHHQVDLDTAITAHGRILHDAVVISVNNTPGGDLGTIHWQDLGASGLSELVSSLATSLGEGLLDQQIATALLTGIVAETEHFGNKKTTPQTMTMSATLLAAGANQQLVATELDNAKPKTVPAVPAVAAEKPVDPDLLKISHANATAEKLADKPKEEDAAVDSPDPSMAVDASLEELLQEADKAIENHVAATENHTTAPVVELPQPKPTVEETLPEIGPAKAFGPTMDLPDAAPVADPANEPTVDPLQNVVPPVPPTPTPAVEKDKTLSDIEAAVKASEDEAPAATESAIPTDVNSARQAVEDALKVDADTTTPPLEALNAVPVNLNLGHTPPTPDVAPTPAAPEAEAQPGPGMPYVPPAAPTALPDYLQAPSATSNQAPPTVVAPTNQPVPMPPVIPTIPPGINVAPPQVISPTSSTTPPQGPPPPPVPPPMPPFSQG